MKALCKKLASNWRLRPRKEHSWHGLVGDGQNVGESKKLLHGPATQPHQSARASASWWHPAMRYVSQPAGSGRAVGRGVTLLTWLRDSRRRLTPRGSDMSSSVCKWP